MEIEIDNKYTVVLPENNKEEKFKALRFKEEWRDLTGDKLIYAMACKIRDLQDEIDGLHALLDYEH